MQAFFILLLTSLVRLYQLALSPLLPPSCRFAPSCSEYMIVALRRFGVLRGGWLGARRILRCHPWGGCGCDPVPEVWPKRGTRVFSAPLESHSKEKNHCVTRPRC